MGERGTGSLKVRTGGRLHMEREEVTPRPRNLEDQQWAPEDMGARDRLVEHHLPLVRRLCKRFRDCGEPLEDLIQIGTIGLIKAVEKFDPSRGFSFITYAVPVIVGEIKNFLRDHGWAVKVPRKLQKQKLMVQRAVETLTQTRGRSPTVQEIAEATDLTQEEIFGTFELVNYGRPLSLDEEYGGTGGDGVSSLVEYVGSEDPQFDKLSDRIDLNPNPPKDTDGRREDSGRGWVRELQGRWPGVGVDGRPADGLQSPHRAPKALCGSCDARDGERIRSRGLSRPGWREIAGTLSQLQAGRQAGNGMACSRAKARLNWVSQGQRRGRCKVRRRAERVIRPTRAKTRRLRVLVITVRSPRPIRAVQRARLCAITWTASQAPLAAKRADGMWFSPTPYLRSRMAFSTSAWRR